MIKRYHKHGDLTDAVAEIRRNGVIIVENLFPPEVMDGLLTGVEGDLNAQTPGGGAFFGNSKRSVNGLFARGVGFSEHLLLSEQLLQLADGILLPEQSMAAATPRVEPTDTFSAIDPVVGPNCHHYHVNASVVMQVCQGGGNQMLHRDEWRYRPYMTRDPEGPELTLAFMVALTDFTVENGATRYIPGSNHWPEGQRPDESQVEQAKMARGSVAAWLGSVYHGLAINHTETPRSGLIFSYGVNHLIQEENQFMAVPPAAADALPKKARQLIGYRSSPALNFIEGLDEGHVLDLTETFSES